MKFALLALLTAFIVACSKPGAVLITPDNPGIIYTGRFDFSEKSKPEFMYSGCAIKTIFSGTSIELLLKDDSLRNLFTVVLDDSVFVFTANESDSTYLLAQNLKNTKHHIEIIRRSEWHGGNTTFLGFKLDSRGRVNQPEKNDRRIEFIGNSYTCGYGNEGLSQTENFRYETENNFLTYAAITARTLKSDYLMVCRSGIGMVQGYGGIREFNMPAVYDEVISSSEVVWDYTLYQPHLVIIDLIANDLSAPVDSAEFVNTYTLFLKKIRNNYPMARIMCLAGPSSPGQTWQTIRNYIHAVVDESGKSDNMVSYFEFTPFEPHGSDWHPNVAEHRKMADELIPFVQNLMNW